MKKWISRGIVLAMALALVIPTPVLAKSSKGGGKLVKSVTVTSYISYNGANQSRPEVSKTTYTYDKKKNPKEIKDVYYSNYFMGVPVYGVAIIDTAKYKYKGRTPKSMKMYNTVGAVSETRKYKKGKPVRIVGTDFGDDDDPGSTNTTYTYNYSYTKKGLPKVVSELVTGSNGTSTYSNTYAWTQKKGIPSLVLDTYVNSQNPDENGVYYIRFNKKGLAVESGRVNSATGAYEPFAVVSYVMKKGLVKEANVYSVYGGKQTLVTNYKFKYTNKKISKVRYFNMIDSFVSSSGSGRVNCFNWY